MGRLFGLILIVLCVWVGIEIYDKGVDHAFGGVFAWFDAPLRSDQDDDGDAGPRVSGSLPQRVGAKVQGEINDAARRRHETDGGDEEDND